ncbi:FAD binding domain-containing protein [Myxococcota bacterium]|nr:FAD binding domain-containing protein [Myxococcota bacterium]MBU1380980.1 FAD binding domain-containing protein [Myxococcota bacterium]MBU1498821.1 FAD binding domain-containing protein [Myxococcota bacterium]
MINVEQYDRPDTLKEALELLAKEGAVALAGGTSMSLAKNPSWNSIVDLSDIEEIQTIEEDDEFITIGAMVTMTEIFRHPGNMPCSISAAARAVSSTPIRNMTTVGGSLARSVYWNDLPVALLSLGASVGLASAHERRRISIDELYTSHPSKVLKSGEIITDVKVELGKYKTNFIKLARTHVDYALLNVCASLEVKGNVIANARISVGGAVNMARLVIPAGELLSGQQYSDDLFIKAGETAAESIEYRSDFRVNREYQKAVTAKLVTRSLRDAWNNCECNETDGE